MTFDPTDFVGEILGERAALGMDPASKGYSCPYKEKFLGKADAKCKKAIENGIPLPVCSVMVGGKPVAVCPWRMHQAAISEDIIEHCWRGAKPDLSDRKVVSEIRMPDFGAVDLVVAAAEPGKREISEFISAEVQAIDISGSVRSAYNAILAKSHLTKRPKYNLNWDNVYKRYITQLIRKGYVHHRWETRIVGVIQDVVYDYVVNSFKFLRTKDVSDESVNIVFLVYGMEEDKTQKGRYRLILKKVEGTSHANLQQAVLYKQAPSEKDFVEKVMDKAFGKIKKGKSKPVI